MTPLRSSHRLAFATLGVLLPVTVVHAATLEPGTVQAWSRYVARTEARLARENGPQGLVEACSFVDAADRARLMAGEAVAVNATEGGDDVPGGLVHHWRGCMWLPDTPLDSLLHALQHPPEAGPYQEDVTAMRVVSRSKDGLGLYIRMRRRQMVTVTYDTWHDVTYHRLDQAHVISRSVATRIVEVEHAGTDREQPRPAGDDHGFLWRMNAYWRYAQAPGGVFVEVESLTLSREVPWGFRTIVGPLITRVARESMERTLVGLRDLYAPRVASR
jgi:hypothetical protein